MGTLFQQAFVKLDEPVPVGRAAVIGYDRRLRTPVLSFGARPVPFTDVQRGGYESGEPMFTEAQERQIEEAVAHLHREE